MTSKAVMDAARETLDESNGQVAAAAEAFEAKVRRNRKLRDELTDGLIASACYEAICEVQRGRREVIWTAPNYSGDSNERLRSFAANSLMRFPLLDGLTVGEADHAALSKTAHFYEAQSRSMGVRGHWLRMVASRLPAGKIVRAVLTEAQLGEMQQAAQAAFQVHADAAE